MGDMVAPDRDREREPLSLGRVCVGGGARQIGAPKWTS